MNSKYVSAFVIFCALNFSVSSQPMQQPIAQPWSMQVSETQLVVGGSLLFGLSFLVGCGYYHYFRVSMGNDIYSRRSKLATEQNELKNTAMTYDKKILSLNRFQDFFKQMEGFKQDISKIKITSNNNNRCTFCKNNSHFLQQNKEVFDLDCKKKHDLLLNNSHIWNTE
jgi:hypothetical protein